ncbi:lysophospholipid acyltransferase family protein [Rhodococcus sp. NPDC058521]|uniref:lysophospholipid acyltransferase family protein n=1 Tax=Rhodococcus sp. NPDC058521 TaxID=3346536 RepID=UPI003655F32A
MSRRSSKRVDRPEVTLENSRAVYDYYRDHQQNRALACAAYGLLAARYRPRITYGTGAERALRDVLGSRSVLLVAANHLSEFDQYTLAATAWRTPLRGVIGRTRVLAKDEVFDPPRRRREVDVMGGIPVFRSKNHGLRAVADAGRLMMEVSAERLARGDNLAVFPEGTCNYDDPPTVQHVNSGIGHIASRATKAGASVALLSVGIAYDPDSPHGDPAVKSASVFLAEPVLELPQKPIDISRLVHADLQKAVDGAIAAY